METLIKKNVAIKFGKHDAIVDLYVNKEGNIRIVLHDEETLAPDGTCIEGYNTEVIFYPYHGANLEAQEKLTK